MNFENLNFNEFPFPLPRDPMRVKIQNATNPTNHTQKLGKQKQTKRKKKKKYAAMLYGYFLVCWYILKYIFIPMLPALYW